MVERLVTSPKHRHGAPQAIIGILLPVALAAYGFRYALAGQPVVSKLLGDAGDAGGPGRNR